MKPSLSVLPLFAALSFLLPPQPASAQMAPVTKAEASCRGAIAKATAKVIKAFDKAVLACHKARDLDASKAAVDCNELAQADPGGKVAKTIASARAGILKKCEGADAVLAQYARCPVPVETVDDGGDTTGIDDFGELADCLFGQAVVLGSRAAREVLASPAPPLADDLAGCHAALGSAYTKVIDTTMKERAKCQQAADKAGGALDFSCNGADPGGKIDDAVTKAKAAVTAACSAVAPSPRRGARSTALDTLGSCGSTADELATCAVEEEAATTSAGASAMAYELPGNCPGAGAYSVATDQSQTDLDVGWSGFAHDMHPIAGYRALRFQVSCDADCNNCTSTSATTDADACRCSNDSSTVCTTNSDCSGACQCYFGPPTPYSAGGTAACVVAAVNGTVSGSFNPASGEMAVDVPLRQRIYLGLSLLQPCPTCEAGVCNGGARNGLACEVDGSDSTFGSVSFDCMPSPLSNISGAGLVTPMNYNTGSLSLPFGDACEVGYPGAKCACGACALDSTMACTTDASCGAFGPCNGGGTSRRQNACDDGICSWDGGGEGVCDAGPIDTYCDGLTDASGEGLIPCIDDSDCSAWASQCPGSNCGSCSLPKLRNCFLDPITATGTPGSMVVGEGCLAVTTSAGINSALGLPGAFRIQQNVEFEPGLCSDGVTPFIPPGGSNCP